jgi:hypothetical protein
MHGLGHAGDPGHQIVECRHGTGEHCTLVIHRVSLSEGSRKENGQTGSWRGASECWVESEPPP